MDESAVTDLDKYRKMDPEWKAKWLAALRSGKYEQGRRCLRRIDRQGATTYQYCCLGVLCDVFDPTLWVDPDPTDVVTFGFGESWFCEQNHFLPIEVGQKTGLRDLFAKQTLVQMNDGDDFRGTRCHSFAEIADWVEQNL